jgi:hypothetical protein
MKREINHLKQHKVIVNSLRCVLYVRVAVPYGMYDIVYKPCMPIKIEDINVHDHTLHYARNELI